MHNKIRLVTVFSNFKNVIITGYPSYSKVNACTQICLKAFSCRDSDNTHSCMLIMTPTTKYSVQHTHKFKSKIMNHNLAKRDCSIATCTQTQMLTKRATHAPSHVSDGVCGLPCVPQRRRAGQRNHS